jgi:hypothetical protein
MRTRALLTIAALVVGVLLVPAPAQAAARVSVKNDQGSSTVDPTYATTLTVNGSGFQSVKGGHGGIYVFFGIKVSGGYLYVPDSETADNQGFQKFVAFPGSDTADSANGGTIKADGTWRTSLTVPGATFNAVNRSGKAQKVSCRASTCGIITIGAHGVKNARNETFTPISFADLQAAPRSAPTTAPTAPAAASSSDDPATPSQPAATSDAPAATTPAASGAAAAAALTVDQATAVAGRAMSFNVVGLGVGDQVVASFDDGIAAIGPLSVGPNGQVAGTIQLPAETRAGTHTLKITGTATTPSVNFPVRAAAAEDASATTAASEDVAWVPISFAALACMALLGALIFATVRIRSIRRTRAAHA